MEVTGSIPVAEIRNLRGCSNNYYIISEVIEMASNYVAVKNSRKKRKEDIVYVMGGECKLCGYHKAITALELHHLNPEQKDFAISQCLNRSWEEIKAEIPKCILLCSNCHREVHEGLVDKELVSSFSEEKANEISAQIEELKTHKLTYCQSCGAIVTAGAKHCVKCSNELHRVVERPSREELKSLIRTKSFSEIGRLYGVSDNAIRRWCTSYDLPSRKADIKSIADVDWLDI